MNDVATSPEQRQHLSLSQYAYDTVKSDSLNFLGKINISGFINKIVENSKLDSFDKISSSEETRLRNELLDSKKTITEQDENTISKLAAAHTKNYIRRLKDYPKDQPLKIRLNNSLHKEFYPSSEKWSGLKYEITQGEYIKSLVEEYARKTIFEREAIFFKETLETIKVFLDIVDKDKRMLEITHSNGRKYLCRPYRLSEDFEANYNYLIGISKEVGTTEEKINSFRISRIKEIKARGDYLGSGKITKKEEATINKRIKESTVPYLLDPPVHYEIKLTKKGLKTYNAIYHKRPACKFKEKNNLDKPQIIEVYATDRQISDYFHQFGEDAIIITPDKAKSDFRRYYTAAARAYKE